MIALLRLLSVYLAATTTIGTFNSVMAQAVDGAATGEPPGGYARLAFDAADSDGDGLVSEAELARDAAAGFSGLDQDRSETLTPQELGPHDPAMFSRVDQDGDGVLTFSEVMNNKLRALQAGDVNQDGGLSFEEMLDTVEAEQGALQ